MPDPEIRPATILVVEDEEEVRALARDVLEMNGYRVLEALDVADATRLSETHPGTIDLLITDVVMPGTSGPELARRLRVHRPGLRVLCMSGYPESADQRIEGEAGWNAWLQKPFTPDVLMEKVRDCLTS
ncbi:MAG TPA: response regulator [Candidatus Limnocylindria bacterium]|jgi:DNA-binding response OmpR family regulator|nr:response regulator [Candidatus Limnocylindria bacterium]